MFRIMWWLQEWLHSARVLQFYSNTINMPSLRNKCIHHTSNLQVFFKTFPSQGTPTRFFWACSTHALFFWGLVYIPWLRCWQPRLRFLLFFQPIQINKMIVLHIWSHICHVGWSSVMTFQLPISVLKISTFVSNLFFGNAVVNRSVNYCQVQWYSY